jgi:COP9 signalosome complex subunit 6
MTDQTAIQLEVLLHPLVVVNISDQVMRERTTKKSSRVFGVLLGEQQGRKVEVTNSFEMLLESTGRIDIEFMKTRQAQFNRVFENQEILGWYTTGSGVQPNDIDLYEQMETFNESPLFMLLNPDWNPEKSQTEKSAFKFHEVVVKIVNGKPSASFSPLSFQIATTEMERIGVDHVAKSSNAGISPFATHVSTLHSSINMLHVRISIVKHYLEDVKAGKLAFNQEILREIMGVCHQLPAIGSGDFNQAFFTEYSDALLVTYMATLTKAASSTNEMLEKFNLTQDRQFRKRGMF